MPITITITDPTPEQIAALFGAAIPTPQTAYTGPQVGAKGTRAKSVPKIETSPIREVAEASAAKVEDAELAAELAADAAEAEPMPATATAVVDAGTGKPLPAAQPVDLAEVRALATRLAQADTPALARLIKEAGSSNGKLSGIGSEALPGFAAAVQTALAA